MAAKEGRAKPKMAARKSGVKHNAFFLTMQKISIATMLSLFRCQLLVLPVCQLEVWSRRMANLEKGRASTPAPQDLEQTPSALQKKLATTQIKLDGGVEADTCA